MIYFALDFDFFYDAPAFTDVNATVIDDVKKTAMCSEFCQSY